MAYAITHYRVQVRGALDAGETWSNTWAVIDTLGGQDPTDLAAFFHDLYDGMKAARSQEWTATNAFVKNLGSGLLQTLPFATVTGEQSADALPTECAIRLSLSDNEGRRGGPFLAGFTSAALAADGTYDTGARATLATLVNDFFNDLNTSDWAIGLDSPTDVTVVPVAVARIGQVFDVIRRRRNDIPESYLDVTVP